MKKMKTPLTALALTLALAANAFAADAPQSGIPQTDSPQSTAQPDTPAARTLAPVVVTASRVPEKLADVTSSVTVIPQEEIAKGQYQSLSGLLRNYGIQVDSYGPNQNLNRVRLRGMSTSFNGTDQQSGVLVLLDGRSIGTDNISMIPLAAVERVEILRGPGSVQYGSSGMGGVINIISRRGTEDFHASVEAGLGSFNSWQAQGWAAGKVGAFDFAVAGQGYDADNYNIGDGGKAYHNTDLAFKGGYMANLGVNFANEHRIGLSYTSLGAYDMGSPYYYPTTGPDGWGGNNLEAYTDRSNASLDVQYEGGYKDWGLSWMARYYTGLNQYRYDMHNNPYPDPFQFHNRYQGSQAQISWKKGILTLTGGVDWLRNDTAVMSSPSYPFGQESESSNVGQFLMAKLAFFDDALIVSGGVRNDDFYLGMQNKDRHLNHVSPTVGIAWHATDWLTLKANYGEGFRAPTALELLGFKGLPYGPTLPNSSLEPEVSYGWDAGFDIEYKALRMGLTYFQTQYDNKIVYTSNVVSYWPVYYSEAQYINAPKSIWCKGLEGYASFDIGEALEWPVQLRPYVNFTHMTERQFYDGTTALNIPDWTISYGVNFAYPKVGFSADLRCNYYGNQIENDSKNASWRGTDYKGTGNNTVVDLFLSQKVYSNDKIGSFSIQANVRNIFDEKYALVKDYPMPGRSFYVGVKWEY